MTLILLIFEGFTSADGDTSVLLQGLVGAVNDFKLMDSMLDVESSRGKESQTC